MADVTQPLISSPTDKNVQEGEDSVDEFKSSLRVPSYKAIAFKVYPWRWFMLLSLCVLNVSNGMVCNKQDGVRGDYDNVGTGYQLVTLN